MKRPPLVRFFNSLGYVALYIQWAWLLTLFVPVIVDSGYLTQPQSEPAPSAVSLPADSAFEPLFVIAAVLLAVAALAFAAYAIAKSPGVATNAGEKVTSRAANFAIPHITHHKKLSKKKRLELSRRVQYSIKLILCALAFVLLFITPFVNALLPLSVTITVGAVLLPWGPIWFTLAYMLTRKA